VWVCVCVKCLTVCTLKRLYGWVYVLYSGVQMAVDIPIPWNRVLETLVKKCSTFYGTRWFIIVFIRAFHHHCTLSRAGSIRSTLIPCFCKIHVSITLLSTRRSSKLALPHRFSDKNCVCISHLPRAIYILITKHVANGENCEVPH